MLSMDEMNELEHSGITDLIDGLDSCFEVNPEPGIDRRPVAALVSGCNRRPFGFNIPPFG